MTLLKAQAAVEFVIILSILLSIFLILIVILENRGGELQSITRRYDARQLAEQVAYTINQVHLSGIGTRTSFYLPSYLEDNSNYTLVLYADEKTVEIMGYGERYTAPLLTRLYQDYTLVPGTVIIIYTEEGIKIV